MHTGVLFDVVSYFFRNAEMVSEEGAEKFFHGSRFLGSIGLRRVLGCLPGNRLFLRIGLVFNYSVQTILQRTVGSFYWAIPIISFFFR